MPTSSNIPRLSEADEALMWNILDFSSSSSPAETIQLGNLVPSPYQRMETVSPNFLVPPIMSETQDTVHNSNREQRALMGPELSSQNPSPLNGPGPGPVGMPPISEWPFLNRFDTALPDLPDWMIFGDYGAEQL
jgi:hypothetical protein